MERVFFRSSSASSYWLSWNMGTMMEAKRDRPRTCPASSRSHRWITSAASTRVFWLVSRATGFAAVPSPGWRRQNQ